MINNIKPVLYTAVKWLAIFAVSAALLAGLLFSGILPVRLVLDKPAPAATALPPAAAAKPPAAPMAPAIDYEMQDRQDSATLVIQAKQRGCYRLAMLPDYNLTYFWKTDGKTLNLTFRGEPKKPKGKEVLEFGKLTAPGGKGFFIPPYEGNYTWCWQNPTAQTVTVEINTQGMYPDKGIVVEWKTE